jgi:riboflavin synthase
METLAKFLTLHSAFCTFHFPPMFTGIVEVLSTVVDLAPEPPGVRMAVALPQFAAELKLGESIAINGCCLTVVEIARELVEFQAGEETLRRTNLGQLKSGDAVNIERSLRAGDRLGGHFVLGHIDGLATLERRDDSGDWSTCWFQAPVELVRQMASKGSVALDGVSLTLVDVEAERFSVALIPHTLAVTTLGRRQVGDTVNLETDVLAKYVERQLKAEGRRQKAE